MLANVAHIKQPPLEARLVRLKAALVGLIGVDDIQGLKSLELSLKSSSDIGADRIPIANAIKVLIEECGYVR